MRKLLALCKRLKRIGVNCCVVSHGRRDYTVVYSVGSGWYSARSCTFSTVRECEQFLVTLFR